MSMKHFFFALAAPATLVIAAALLLQGCGQADTVRRAGTWELDTQAAMEAMEAEVAAIEDPEQKKAMEHGMSMMGAGMLEAMDMSLTLNPDGTASSTTSMMGRSETVTGKWSAEGDLLTIEMTRDGEFGLVNARVDGDLLRLLPPEENGMPIPIVLRKHAE